MNVSEDDCVAIIQKYEQCPEVKNKGLLSVAGNYLDTNLKSTIKNLNMFKLAFYY